MSYQHPIFFFREIKDRSVLKLHETNSDQPQKVKERQEIRGRTVQTPVTRSHSRSGYGENPTGNNEVVRILFILMITKFLTECVIIYTDPWQKTDYTISDLVWRINQQLFYTFTCCDEYKTIFLVFFLLAYVSHH